jgi:hypothetical protein
MCERHRFSHETPELDVNCFPAAENGDDEDDDDEEQEERRHDEEEEEEEEPIWTASGALIGIERTRGRVLAVNQKSEPVQRV